MEIGHFGSIGNTESKLDESDPDYPTGFVQTEGMDPTITDVIQVEIMRFQTDFSIQI